MFAVRRFVVAMSLALLMVPLLPVPRGYAIGSGEVGVSIGVQAPDEHLAEADDFLDQTEAIAGLRGELFVHDRWGAMADILYSEINTGSPVGNARMSMARLAADWYPRGWDKQGAWFVSGGAGWMWVDMEVGSAADFNRPLAALGVGQRWKIGPTATLRWEIRGDHTFGSTDDIVGISMGQMEGLVTIAFPWGGGGDGDGDGVRDSEDDCPGTPKGAQVDERGCAIDSDGDGVADGLDQCPDTPKGAVVDPSGCPIDADGDGVPDGIDLCARTPQGATVDASGCPQDSDRDGVPDGLDLEAATMAGVLVDASGRSVDRDGDGVFDGLDVCPDTPQGTPVDATGCPQLFSGEKAALVLEGVTFETGSDVLTAESRGVLDRVVASLAANPDVRVEVGGHTDSQGSASFNERLSLQRAQAVMRYLVAQGIAEDRLEAKGYGPAEPITSNETAEGRARNRRVELERLP
jgi:outer membrane protein OmpA-like peptidoglycan-associated protein